MEITDSERGAEETEPKALLIVGYGNLSRRDDGVAFHILQRLRARLGLPALEPDAEDELWGKPLGMGFTHQLVPEIAEAMAQYDVVVFVDAHVAGGYAEPLHWEELSPGYRPGIVSHHLHPASVLALCRTLYGGAPRGYVLSVLGHDFDFGEELSPETAALAEQAVDLLMDFLQQEGFLAAP